MPTVQLLYIAKSGTGPGIKTEEVMRIFETENDLEKIKTTVEQSQDRLYVSWASVDVTDKAHERIPIEEVAAKQDVLLERGGPITDEHTNKIIGQTLGYKIMQHPKSGKLGVLHLNKIYDHNMHDDKVWDEIKSGKRTGSSVGGFNEEESYETDDKGLPVRVLRGFNHMETASVFEPCNPLALNESVSVVAKSARNINIDVKKESSEEEEQKEPEQETESDVLNKFLELASTESWNEIIEMIPEHPKDADEFVLRYTKNYSDKEAVKTLEDNIGLEMNWDAVEAAGGPEDPDKEESSDEEKNSSDTQKRKSVIKNEKKRVCKHTFNKTRKEELTMDEQVEKAFTDLNKRLETVAKAVESIVAKEDKKEDKEDMPEDKEAKKSEVEKEVNEAGKEIPEDNRPEEENQEDVYKAENEELKKKIATLEKKLAPVSKSTTTRPSEPTEDVQKSDGLDAKKIALGEIKKGWNELNRDVRKQVGGVRQ